MSQNNRRVVKTEPGLEVKNDSQEADVSAESSSASAMDVDAVEEKKPSPVVTPKPYPPVTVKKEEEQYRRNVDMDLDDEEAAYNIYSNKEDYDDPDDPIVQEFDVKLASNLADYLYLFQFPNRPASLPYNDVSYCTARMKEQQQKIELEFPLNTQSNNYDQRRGEELASEAIDQDTGDYMFESSLMDKHVLTSTQMKQTANYCCGVLDKGTLHITPVKETLLLRPRFTHLDPYEPPKKEEKKGNKPVNVNKPLTSQERRIKEIEEEIAEEWTEYKVYSDRIQNFDKVFKRLYSQGNNVLEFPQDTDEYLKNVAGAKIAQMKLDEEKKHIPDTAKNNTDKKKVVNKEVGLVTALQLPIPERVIQILKNAQVLPFKRLLSLAKVPSHLAIQALDVICESAYLIHGCWVIKSDIVFPNNYNIKSYGYSGATLAHARDYILYKFSKLPNPSKKAREDKKRQLAANPTAYSYCAAETPDGPESQVGSFFDPVQLGNLDSYEQYGYLRRSQLMEDCNMSLIVITAILKTIAFSHPPYGWTFQLDTDEEFITKHPTYAQRELLNWEVREKGNPFPINKFDALNNTSREETMLIDYLSANGVISKNKLTQLFAKLNTKTVEECLKERTIEMNPTWCDMTYYVLKHARGGDDTVRSAIIELFIETPTVKRLDVKALLDKQNIELNNTVWGKIIKELAIKQTSTIWAFKKDN